MAKEYTLEELEELEKNHKKEFSLEELEAMEASSSNPILDKAGSVASAGFQGVKEGANPLNMFQGLVGAAKDVGGSIVDDVKRGGSTLKNVATGNFSGASQDINDMIKKRRDQILGSLSFAQKPAAAIAAGLEEGAELVGLAEPKDFSQRYKEKLEGDSASDANPKDFQTGKIVGSSTIGALNPLAGLGSGLAYDMGSGDTGENTLEKFARSAGQTAGGVGLAKGVGAVSSGVKGLAKKALSEPDLDVKNKTQLELGRQGIDTTAPEATNIWNEKAANLGRGVSEQVAQYADDLGKIYGALDNENALKSGMIAPEIQRLIERGRQLESVNLDPSTKNAISRQIADLEQIQNSIGAVEGQGFIMQNPTTFEQMRGLEKAKTRASSKAKLEGDPAEFYQTEIAKGLRQNTRRQDPRYSDVDSQYSNFKNFEETQLNNQGDLKSRVSSDIRNLEGDGASRGQARVNIQELKNALAEFNPELAQSFGDEASLISKAYNASKDLSGSYGINPLSGKTISNWSQAYNNWKGRHPSIDAVMENINKMKGSDQMKMMMFNATMEKMKEQVNGTSK